MRWLKLVVLNICIKDGVSI